MALQRFNSVGGGRNGPKSRMSSSSLSLSSSSASASPTTLTSPSRPVHLVALRYEETVQAKPPIMITKHSSSSSGGGGSSTYLARSRSTLSTRSQATMVSTPSSHLSAASPLLPSSLSSMPALSPSISPSSISTSLSPSPSPSPYSSSSTVSPSTPSTSSPVSPRYPLVILRPPGLAVPPTEQHPALRTPTFHPIVEEGCEEVTAEATSAEETVTAATLDKETNMPCKRDSILASESASTVSLWPEDAQENKDAEDEDEDDDAYSSCMCSSASRRSKVVSVSVSAPVRDAPLPPAEKPTTTAPVKTTNNETNTTGPAPNEDTTPAAAATASRVAPVGPATTLDKPSQEPQTAQPEQPSSSVTREKSWRLPRTSFSFRASTFQRNSKKKRSVSLDSTVPRVPQVHCEDGLISVVVPGDNGDTGTAHENEGSTAGGNTVVNAGILPTFTAQSPLLPAGSFQFSGSSSRGEPATAPHQVPQYHQHRLSKPNPSWPPMLASPHQHAPSIAPTLSLGMNPHTTSIPFPSISTFSSFPTPSLPSLPSLPHSSPDQQPTSPPRPAQTPTQHFFLRVLSMSDSRQKRQKDRNTTEKDANIQKDRDNLVPLINTTIPTERLIEDDFLQSLTFSKRGSLMFGGKRAVVGASASAASFLSPLSVQSSSSVMDPPPLAPAVERESLQVRSLYASGTASDGSRGYSHSLAWEDGRPPSIAVSPVSPSVIAEEVELEEEDEKRQKNGQQTQNESTVVKSSSSLQEPQEPSQEEPSTPSLLSPPPDVSSLSIAATDYLRPDPVATSPTGNADARTSIVSATSATTASTGIALTEGTESSLSLVAATTPQPSELPSEPSSSPIRNEYELAGGLEDWEDVDVADVDRFGFIHVRRQQPLMAASSVAVDGDADADEQTVNGNSSGLASGIGRRFSRRYRSPSARRRNKTSTAAAAGSRSVHTSRSTSTTATAAAAARSSIRAAANQLPHNRDRRWIDEAGEMLTLEPGLADIAEDEDAERLAEVLKRKEWERAEKWRRMAKTPSGAGAGSGGGMDYEFDLQHPKLAERTWKGIPDRWRAPAWYSFLASSAQHRRAQRMPTAAVATEAVVSGEGAAAAAVLDGGETDTQIVAAFHRLQATASPDDVQIDLDVPRTVNGHVMFRKRYRGGQRLLFRVLHALSLYFRTTGYVQGMASLAATLLCYYDEERCFVMLVRLFHLRGLERLFEPGFGGLMEALGEFEQQWLARNNRRVAQKLASLNIDATTYATRWYLTLFNLSVPFPAQLRIWDVFMLLGDADNDTLGAGTRPGTARTTRPSTAVTTTYTPAPEAEMTATAMITANAPTPTASKANLAILHATSTALIDGLQEVLLDADFENAMKAVTSWVPIKDEELLMKVVHAEWKRYQKRKSRR